MLIARQSLAVALVAAGIIGAYSQPTWPMVLTIGLALYVVILALAPSAWLVILPAALPLLDLAPWSGRLFFTEYDCLLLISLAMSYWRAPTPPRYGDRALAGRLIIALLGLSYVASAVVFFEPPQPYTTNSTIHYHSPYNALRIAKGFLWAWLLLPALRNELRTKPHAVRHLLLGVAVGLLSTGCLVAWERGLLAALSDQLSMQTIAAQYRQQIDEPISALFSSLHIGGEALSAFLILAVPCALGLVVFAHSLRVELFGLLALIAGLYAIAMAGSPTLYLACATATLAFMIAVATTLHRHVSTLFGSLTATAIVAAICHFGYAWSGLAAAAVAVLIALLALLGGFSQIRRHTGFEKGFALISTVAISALYLVFEREARIATTPLYTTLFTLMAATALIGPAWMVGRTVGHLLHPWRAVLPLLAMLFIWTGMFNFTERYQRGADTLLTAIQINLSARMMHWQNVLTMRNRDPVGVLLGNGVGSFPTTYYWYDPNGREILEMRLVDGQNDSLNLALGAGEFGLMQRVHIHPDQRYTLTVSLRAPRDTMLSAKLCERNIMHSSTNAARCQFGRFPVPGTNVWQTGSVLIDSADLGKNAGFGRPVSLLISNATTDTQIEIEQLSLTDNDGSQLLRNGDFRQGRDHWMFFSDANERVWHVQNLYLHMLIEHGVFGLTAFVIALFSAIARAVRVTATQRIAGSTLAAALLGGACLGLFASIVDVPRIATLFYLLMFTALTIPIATLNPSSGPINTNGRAKPDSAAH